MYDFFISYARADNRQGHAAEAESRWVQSLVELLEGRLGTLLARNAQIYLDKQMEIGTAVSKELLEAVADSRLLLVVLSPRYLASAWCRMEMNRFLEAKPDVAETVFVVEAEQIERERWPESLRNLQTISLWEENRETKIPERLDPQLGPEYERLFKQRVFGVAHTASRRLNLPVVTRKSKGKVWIAEATDDVVAEREKLAEAVRQAGWDVIPRAHYPRHDRDAYLTSVQQDLDAAKMFVQLLGPYAGQRPDWGGPEFPILQGKAASFTALQRNVRLLRWRKKESLAAAEGTPYAAFLKEGDVQESTIGEFINEVIRCLGLLELAPPPPPPHPHEDQPMMLYVHSDDVDRDLATQIQASLLKMKVESIGTPTAAAGDSPSTIRLKQLQPLDGCDGVILVYGDTKPTWVQSQFAQIRKQFATVRPSGRIGLLSGPPPPKEGLPIASPVVRPLNCVDGLKPDVLAEFVSLVRDPNPRDDGNV